MKRCTLTTFLARRIAGPAIACGIALAAGAAEACGAERVELAPDTTITIRSSGTNLEFLPARISAKQGTRVTVRYVNEGTLPHNFVVVRNENDIDTLGRAAFEAKDTEYVPLQHEALMIAHSALAAPGATVEVSFVMPSPGEYFFVCLYSGHYNMMVGTLRSLN
jgi:azurin